MIFFPIIQTIDCSILFYFFIRKVFQDVDYIITLSKIECLQHTLDIPLKILQNLQLINKNLIDICRSSFKYSQNSFRIQFFYKR